MNLSETTHALAVLGPLFGALSTVLAGWLWLGKRHIHKLEDDIRALKNGNETFTEKVAKAEARAKRFERERDQARTERDQARAEIDSIRAEHESQIRRIEDDSQKAYQSASENYAIARQNADIAQQNADMVRKCRATLGKCRQHTSELEGLVEQLQHEIGAAHGERSLLLKRLLVAEGRGTELTETNETINSKLTLANQAVALLQVDKQRLEAELELIRNQGGNTWVSQVSGVLPFVRRARREARIISVMNLKGGVGKTTIAANLSGVIGADRKRVLMLDLDHQRSLSQMLLPTEDRLRAAKDAKTIQHFLQHGPHEASALIKCAVELAEAPGCSVVSAVDSSFVSVDRASIGVVRTLGLEELEMELFASWIVKKEARDIRFFLRNALHDPRLGQAFDRVVIDCPPRFSTACINALAASDVVLVPVQFEAIAARGVDHLVRKLIGLRDAGVIDSETLIAVIDNNSPGGMAEGYHDVLRKDIEAAGRLWGDNFHIFGQDLPQSKWFANATMVSVRDEKLKLASNFAFLQPKFEAIHTELENLIR